MSASDTVACQDCSLPGSSVHGILQASILEWVAMPSSIFLTQGLNLCLLCLLYWQAGVGSCSVLQRIFPTEGSNPAFFDYDSITPTSVSISHGIPLCVSPTLQADSLPAEPPGKPLYH